MRKLIVATATVAALATTGVAGAAPRSGEITLVAANPVIVFGQSTDLRGKLLIPSGTAPQVSDPRCAAQRPPATGSGRVTLAADDEGEFGTVIQPLIGTHYTAVSRRRTTA